MRDNDQSLDLMVPIKMEKIKTKIRLMIKQLKSEPKLIR